MNSATPTHLVFLSGRESSSTFLAKSGPLAIAPGSVACTARGQQLSRHALPVPKFQSDWFEERDKNSSNST